VCGRRNKQTRKHKTWDGDAILLVRGAYAELLDTDDRRCVCARQHAGTRLIACRMSSGTLKVNVCEGAEFEMGGKTIEVDRRMHRDEYRSGACFGRGPSLAAPVATSSKSNLLTRKYVPLAPVHLNPTTPTRHAPPAAPAGGQNRFYPAASSSDISPPKAHPIDSHWAANWSALVSSSRAPR
jgi:DNA repair and recombination protein RAD54B